MRSLPGFVATLLLSACGLSLEGSSGGDATSSGAPAQTSSGRPDNTSSSSGDPNPSGSSGTSNASSSGAPSGSSGAATSSSGDLGPSSSSGDLGPGSSSSSGSSCVAESEDVTCEGKCGAQLNNCGTPVICVCSCPTGVCVSNCWASYRCAEQVATACGCTQGSECFQGNVPFCCTPKSRQEACGGPLAAPKQLNEECRRVNDNCQLIDCNDCGQGLHCDYNQGARKDLCRP